MVRTVKLDDETIEFIERLMDRELEAEVIQDNPDNNEVDYVVDLAKYYGKFVGATGRWWDLVKLKSYKEELKLK